jgi:hypothetical protein
MAKAKPKHDYSLNYRVRNHSGNWGEWIGKGFGEWIGLDQLQNQIKMLARSHSRDIEIEFLKDGKLLDFNGNETGKTIIYERT